MQLYQPKNPVLCPDFQYPAVLDLVDNFDILRSDLPLSIFNLFRLILVGKECKATLRKYNPEGTPRLVKELESFTSDSVLLSEKSNASYLFACSEQQVSFHS